MPKSREKNKVLLIYPSCLYAPVWGAGVNMKSFMVNLYSYLKYHEIEVEVLDLENEIGRPVSADEAEEFQNKSLKLISNYDFHIAAISCWTSLSYLSSVMVAKICKQVNPESIVIAGGYHPSAVPSDFIYSGSPFDFIIRGEGEYALLDICRDKIKRHKKPMLIEGKVLNLNRNYVLNWGEYKYFKLCQSDIPIYLSRGCPYTCAFCMEPCKRNGNWRSYSVDKAIREIKRLTAVKNPPKISIMDACFGFNKTWRKNFLSMLIKNKINKLFWAECRIDLLDKEDIDLFSKLNFNIEFGLESCSEKMLSIMNKTRNPKSYLKRARDAITYMNKKEIAYTLFLIFNHPGETCKTYNETIQFLKSLISSQSKISGCIQAQNYAFFPGSHVHMHLKDYEKKYGTVIAHKEWWKLRGSHSKLARTVIPSRDLLDRFSDLNYWRNEIADLNQECLTKMPPRVKAFLWAWTRDRDSERKIDDREEQSKI